MGVNFEKEERSESRYKTHPQNLLLFLPPHEPQKLVPK